MRVVLTGGGSVFALGFRALLQSTSDLELVAQAEDLATALQAVAAHQAEVLVVEASVQTSGGAEVIAGLTREAGGTHVLLVSDWGRERDALDALAAGARGLALKTDSAEELLDAVRRVGRGQSYIAPAFRALVDEPGKLIRGRGQASGADVLSRLSPRERLVLDLTVRGWDNTAIAKELNISIKTVDTHRTRMHRKLGCTRTSELIGFLAENGLLLPPLPQAERSSAQTLLLMVDDDDSQVRAQILHDLAGDGARRIEVANARDAVAELYTNQTGSMLIVNVRGRQPAVADLCRDLLADDAQLARMRAMSLFEKPSA
jgi:two-component system nitrate/nitrite response regulator NarL